MNDVTRVPELPASTVFRLGTLGSVASERFAERIAGFGLKVKHAGLMTAMSLGAAGSFLWIIAAEIIKARGKLPILVDVGPSWVIFAFFALARSTDSASGFLLGAVIHTYSPE